MIRHRLYVGAIGEGVFRSLDHGETFRRAADGMFVECDVRALIADPGAPGRLYLGSEDGVWVSDDGADNWRQLPAPVGGRQVWSLALAPGRPGRLVAGTCPAGVVVSDDSGRSWREGRAAMQADCPRIRHTRVTCVVADPADPDRLWAGVEIDGLHVSPDAGRTWSRVGEGLSSQDVHGLVIFPGSSRMLATTNRDLNASDDGGRTWRAVGLDRALPWVYCRGMAQRTGEPEVLLLGAGDGPPGSEGLVGLSRDGGRTWQAARMPGRANSTVWTFAVHPADAGLVYAASVSGEVYRSTDGGESWDKLAREFGEVRALAWAPA